MSYEGPLGTAQDRSTPSISRRRSKCSWRAACLWTTNSRPMTGETGPKGSVVRSGERFARYALSESPDSAGAFASLRSSTVVRSSGEQPVLGGEFVRHKYDTGNSE